jgi:nicotinate-nucleotide adenylyltransferase
VRVGILGGTFNPPHAGHLALARAAQAALALDEVVIVPAAVQPLKEIAGDPGAEVRAGMCELAFGQEPGMSVSRVEVERGGRSYTVDTLAAVHEARPGDDLSFIVGADAAASLPAWREPRRVLELARLAVTGRSGTERAAVEGAVAQVAGPEALARVEFFEMAPVDVSSSEVRARVAAGEPVEGLVAPSVVARIAELGLYREAVGA